MLKKQTLQQIAKLIKVKEADLKAALESEEEKDLEISEEIISLDEDEQKRFIKNSYEDGKKAGEEMAVDEAKKELGFTYDGKKVKTLVAEVKKKTLEDAKVEPNKKITELEEKIQTLTNTVGDYEKKIADKESEVTTVKINGELYKHIPSFGDKGPAIGADDVIQLMRLNGYEAKIEDNKTVFFKGDKKLTDKLGDPIAPKDVIKSFLTEKKLLVEEQTPEGRGGGDGGGAKSGTLSALKKQFESEGKSLIGQEFNQAVQDAVKAGDFDMNA
jgi:hypothetical protein